MSSRLASLKLALGLLLLLLAGLASVSRPLWADCAENCSDCQDNGDGTSTFYATYPPTDTPSDTPTDTHTDTPTVTDTPTATPVPTPYLSITGIPSGAQYTTHSFVISWSASATDATVEDVKIYAKRAALRR